MAWTVQHNSNDAFHLAGREQSYRVSQGNVSQIGSSARIHARCVPITEVRETSNALKDHLSSLCRLASPILLKMISSTTLLPSSALLDQAHQNATTDARDMHHRQELLPSV